MKEKTKKVKTVADEICPDTTGQNTPWPGDGLKKPGEVIKEDNGDMTIIPEVR